MYKNYSEEIIELLEGIGSLRSVTRGWPQAFDKLPCIAVSEASNIPGESYDDDDYTDEVEYYIRIFTKTSKEGDGLAELVEERMRAEHYRRTFAFEDDNPSVRQRVLRYGKEV